MNTPEVDQESLLEFWGKARPDELAQHGWHPLVYHCLDVAAVAERLLRSHTQRARAWAASLHWDLADFHSIVAYLAFLHDIGKISRPFQGKRADLWPSQALGPLTLPPPPLPHHTGAGLRLWQHLTESSDADTVPFGDWPSELAELPAAAFICHHGTPQAIPDAGRDIEILGAGCIAAAHRFERLAQRLFSPPRLPRPPRGALPAASWWLAGLAVVADWIGSWQSQFPYTEPAFSPDAYLDGVARPRAEQALRMAGISPLPARRVVGFAALTGQSHSPTPMQRWAETAPLPPGPFLAIIEDVTGGGKTEAALLLAQRLMAAERASGLYVALPTMATANAMFDRLANLYRRLFAEGGSPSLALSHSAARLNERYWRTIGPWADAARASEPDEDDPGGDGAGAACAAWLADDRRRAFLAHVGVGTIDQAFLAVLAAKHQALRLFGLADRVLIIDEAHAYDAYMGRELEGLLEFQAAMGGSAVVLSATLPNALRAKLTGAFRRGLRADRPAEPRLDGGYPRATLVSAAAVAAAPLPARPDLRRTIAVARMATPADAVAEIARAADDGAAVAWIRNTVDDVLDGVALLAAAELSAEPFHARYAMGDRLAIEQRLISRLGVGGRPEERAGVFVCSQVLQESLDVDLDLLVTDLAPIDLMLQRAGRLWRHPGRSRPIDGPRLLVVSPDPRLAPSADWYVRAFPRAARVYADHGIQWRSALALFAGDRVRVPDDLPALVEAVYGADAPPLPEPFARNRIAAEGARQAERSLAGINLLSPGKGYADQDAFQPDVRVATRLGDERTVLRLARLDGGVVVPWCSAADPQRAWALSEVAVRADRIADVAPLDPAWQPAAERATSTWTRHDAEKRLLLLTPGEADCWHGVVLDRRGNPLPVVYTRAAGLRWHPG